jgi:mannose PTS system EIIA component
LQLQKNWAICWKRPVGRSRAATGSWSGSGPADVRIARAVGCQGQTGYDGPGDQGCAPQQAIGIVIVAHGQLAREALLAAARHVMGDHDHVRTISIDADYDKAAKAPKSALPPTAVDQGRAWSSSSICTARRPANLCQSVCGPAPRHIVTGANLPMLIKLAQSRHLPLETGGRGWLLAGRANISTGRDLGHGGGHPMITRSLKIMNEKGLHARASAKFVERVEGSMPSAWSAATACGYRAIRSWGC